MRNTVKTESRKEEIREGVWQKEYEIGRFVTRVNCFVESISHHTFPPANIK
jgi:hypothetical protein